MSTSKKGMIGKSKALSYTLSPSVTEEELEALIASGTAIKFAASKGPVGSRNRRAGVQFEQEIVNELKTRGLFPYATTTRFESTSRDGDKVDIMNKNEGVNGRMPFNIQVKNATINPKYHEVLTSMPKGDAINVIFHKKTTRGRTTTKFATQGKYAVLELEDFYAMMAAFMGKSLPAEYKDKMRRLNIA